MSCHFTEKISALIDGELAPAEAAVFELHLPHCAWCRTAHQDFLLLGQQMASSFNCAPPRPALQQEALARILSAAVKHTPHDSSPRSAPVGFFFNLWRNPAWGGAFAALLLCFIAALAFYLNTPRQAPQLASGVTAPAKAVQQIDVPHETTASTTDENVAPQQSTPPPVLASAPAPDTVRRKSLPRSKSLGQAGQFSMASFSESEFSNIAIDSPAGPALSTGRHVEQVMLLLRSFRNARPVKAASGFDLAYEKRQSRKLISQNVVLRREAARDGDIAVESLLENIEPILIDIAHLPEKSATGEVRTLKDRLRRQHVFAMLRASQSANTQEF